MNDSFGNPTTLGKVVLKISHEKISAPYTTSKSAAEIMIRFNVGGEAVPGYASNDGKLEGHVTLTMYDPTIEQADSVFGRLKQDYGLGCAWIETPSYQGCILEYPFYKEYMQGRLTVPQLIEAVGEYLDKRR